MIQVKSRSAAWGTQTHGPERYPVEPMNKRPLQIKTQAFLANLPMFSEMRIEELERVAAATLPIYAPKGQAICQCGDPCTGFHVVVYGQVNTGWFGTSKATRCAPARSA